MSTFPPEIWANIFQYIDFDSYHPLMLTCRMIRQELKRIQDQFVQKWLRPKSEFEDSFMVLPNGTIHGRYTKGGKKGYYYHLGQELYNFQVFLDMFAINIVAKKRKTIVFDDLNKSRSIMIYTDDYHPSVKVYVDLQKFIELMKIGDIKSTTTLAMYFAISEQIYKYFKNINMYHFLCDLHKSGINIKLSSWYYYFAFDKDTAYHDYGDGKKKVDVDKILSNIEQKDILTFMKKNIKNYIYDKDVAQVRLCRL